MLDLYTKVKHPTPYLNRLFQYKTAHSLLSGSPNFVSRNQSQTFVMSTGEMAYLRKWLLMDNDMYHGKTKRNYQIDWKDWRTFFL